MVLRCCGPAVLQSKDGAGVLQLCSSAAKGSGADFNFEFFASSQLPCPLAALLQLELVLKDRNKKIGVRY